MSEEELELLVTIDDPVDPPEEDVFHHLQVDNHDCDESKRLRHEGYFLLPSGKL